MGTWRAAIEFNVADVRQSLAFAVKMVRVGNRIVFDDEALPVESKLTGERTRKDVKCETLAFKVTFEKGEEGTFMLDSGAGAKTHRSSW